MVDLPLTVKLSQAVIANKPNFGGSRGDAGYGFQHDWALCLLVELHEDQKHFLMLFDYHDDIVVLDSADDPSAATFYQVKTKDEGLWTIAELSGGSKRGKPIPPEQGAFVFTTSATSAGSAASTGQSIIGKLYSNVIKFAEHTVHLCFVSNQKLDAKMENGNNTKEYETIRFEQLAKAERVKVNANVRTELSLKKDPNLDRVLQFQYTHLSSRDSDTHARGKLGDFLRNTFGGHKVNASDVYDRMIREIRRKNRYRDAISDFASLCKQKGMADREFSQMVVRAVLHKNSIERWDGIKDFLIAERLSPGVVLALQHAWGLHAAARTDTRNPIDQWLRDVAADFASAYLDDPALYGSIADFLQAGMLHIRARASAEGKDGLDVYQRNEYQMKAALLYEWQDGQETRQLQAAYPEPTEEAARSPRTPDSEST